MSNARLAALQKEGTQAIGMGVGWLRSPAHTIRLWSATLAVVAAGAVGLWFLKGSTRPRATPPAPVVDPAPRSKPVEDALWLMSIGDFEGGHVKLMGLPDQLADPDYQVVENAWATWKLEQVAETKEASKKKEMLREIAGAPAVSAKHRKKALEMIRDLEAQGAH